MAQHVPVSRLGVKATCLLFKPTVTLLAMLRFVSQAINSRRLATLLTIFNAANRAMSDMQIASEYIAYNLHQISSLSGGLQTAVLAHSQGNPDTQWALQFWPSTQNITRAYVALSPDFQGIQIAETNLSAICGSGLCQPSLWQQSAGSQYYDALHGGNFQAVVPTTVVWSHVSELMSSAISCSILTMLV